ncbi:alpha/beta fold hydrolase [Streptomyces polychromogenes]|uniref:Alpha/beta fold hydrolase n=1 Tax=Streptomyces polychromogenes TaxID=67342 RepID=A0ABN0UYN6_9ACTN
MAKHTRDTAAAAAALVFLTGLMAAPAGAATPGPASPAPSSSSSSSPSSSRARFVPGPCPKTAEPVPELAKARCGFLEVPENRARPGGRTLRLATAVLPAVSAKPAAEPVVFMAGGPGGETFDDIPFLVSSGLNAGRDLIVMAQRGNRYDEPNLACPEVDRFNARYVGLGYDSAQAKSQMLDAFKQCRARLTADGTDLGAYNTVENAADFADLRTALGIARWNVYGYSYGTNLALTLLRTHPEGIRAVAIDSVTPPQSVVLPWGWPSAQEGVGAILDACAAQPACENRYPDLRRTLDEQVRRLEAHPLTLTASPPKGGNPVKVVLDGGAVLNVLVANTIKPVDVPAAIDELAHGKPDRFARARAVDATPSLGMTAHGLTESVACAEWTPGVAESDVLAAGRKAFPGWPDTVLAQTPQLPFQFDVCRTWNVPDRAAQQRVAAVSSLPVLLLSGTFDQKTGSEFAKDAARTLSRSTSVKIPGITHWVVPQSPCAAKVLASFLDRPTAPDTGCVTGLAPAPFTITPK